MSLRRRSHRLRVDATRTAFSMIELMMVIAIMVMLLSLIAFLPGQARQDANVRSAAEELAATLREARSMALKRKCTFAVVFNVQNGRGTSGRILNNFDGGHWYRILGPWQRYDTDTVPPWPQLFRDGYLYMQDFLRAMDVCWAGEKHELPAHRVRFLALSDQDNGGFVQPWVNNGDNRCNYQPTYPRPWCGYWDSATGRIFPWGGYDHTLVSPFRHTCTTGFWYEGNEGAITGSLNPVNLTAGNQQLYVQGQPRPVIDARLEDYWFLFYPDGTAAEGQTMNAREQSYNRGFQAGPGGQDLADRYEDIGNEWDLGSPMTSYQSYTGYWYVTLAPDAIADTDQFPSPEAAVESLMPAYRVGLNRLGAVIVTKVMRTMPAGAVLDQQITNWQDYNQISRYYLFNTRTNGSTPYGMPVTDFLTPQMLSQRQWWLQP
jgi:type II secretory pathway pseudopilin PulG